MRVARYSMMGLREPALDKVVLSKVELSVLAKAATILTELRALRNPGEDYEEDGLNTDVALAAHICADLVGGEIPAPLDYAEVIRR